MTDAIHELDDPDRPAGRARLPALAGLDEAAFRAVVEPLRGYAATLPRRRPPAGRTAFVLVVTRDARGLRRHRPLLRLAGGSRPGGSTATTADGDLATYHPLPELAVPRAPAYLLVDVDRGEEFCGVRPEAALPVIRDAAGHRSPSTRASRW